MEPSVPVLHMHTMELPNILGVVSLHHAYTELLIYGTIYHVSACTCTSTMYVDGSVLTFELKGPEPPLSD